MNWIKLNSIEQLEEIDRLSQTQPVLIFKHSTRCSISSTALNRFEKQYKPEDVTLLPAYYLDLLTYRPISIEIANRSGIVHQSPQALLIKDGKCTHESTHFEIDYSEIKSKL
jgi:bacillithiol system protein YtxJ